MAIAQTSSNVLQIKVYSTFLRIKKLSVEVYINLHKLYSEDQEGLISQRIKHRWIVDGEEPCYFRAILDVVPVTDDWNNIQYMTMKTKFSH